MDDDGCPMDEQPFPLPIKILHRLAPLWEHNIDDWEQILGRGPNGRPYFLDDKKLQRANPSLKAPILQKLTASLTYLRALLSSTGMGQWAKLKLKRMTAPL